MNLESYFALSEILFKTLYHLFFCFCFFWWKTGFIYLFFIGWRLITSQYCSGFCHTLTSISHGYTRIPIPIPPPTSLSTRSPNKTKQKTKKPHCISIRYILSIYIGVKLLSHRRAKEENLGIHFEKLLISAQVEHS